MDHLRLTKLVLCSALPGLYEKKNLRPYIIRLWFLSVLEVSPIIKSMTHSGKKNCCEICSSYSAYFYHLISVNTVPELDHVKKTCLLSRIAHVLAFEVFHKNVFFWPQVTCSKPGFFLSHNGILLYLSMLHSHQVLRYPKIIKTKFSKQLYLS